MTEPSSFSGELCIRVKTQDTRGKSHEILQRPLNREKRKLIGKEAGREGCSNLRKRLARENLRFGDSHASIIPSLNVFCHAKKDAIDEELGTKKMMRI